MKIILAKGFYSDKALMDCVYWFSDEHQITIESLEDNFSVNFTDVEDNSELKKNFLRKLNDFNLRSEISARTSHLKDLIVAKAFYPDSIEVEPIGEYKDPVEMDKSDEAKQ